MLAMSQGQPTSWKHSDVAPQLLLTANGGDVRVILSWAFDQP
jgi:hypothetical protein